MLFGYGEKTKAFEKLVKENKLGQAYLFYGDSGIGKFSFAKLLAYFFETGKFETAVESLLDAHIISKAEDESSVGIDKVLEARKFLWQKPLKSPRRLVVIDDAEYLTPEAEGALLKIVEEPPAHALIVFIAHDPQILIPPLASRLAKVYFPSLPKNEVEKFLLGRKVGEKKAREIAGMSFGRIGYALQLAGLEPAKPEEAEDFFGGNIQRLWREGLKKNAAILAWLIERETLAKRYNLNMNLQKKAAEEAMRNGI